jgi:MFS family permease
MSEVNLGLKENWRQFVLLIVINGFVGGMVGLERSILPQLAELEFGMASRSAILSFIIAFGFTKAFTNYFTGRLANYFGRKRLLIIGWLFAIPVPIIIIFANDWSWVVLANVLLVQNHATLLDSLGNCSEPK